MNPSASTSSVADVNMRVERLSRSHGCSECAEVLPPPVAGPAAPDPCVLIRFAVFAGRLPPPSCVTAQQPRRSKNHLVQLGYSSSSTFGSQLFRLLRQRRGSLVLPKDRLQFPRRFCCSKCIAITSNSARAGGTLARQSFSGLVCTKATCM